MIRPQLTPDGTAVRLPLADRAAGLLDDLAIAYTDDPDVIGRLLAAHAATVAHLDHAVSAHDAPDYELAMRAAQADATRDTLTELLPSEAGLDEHLGPAEALRLADDLTAHAARIHLSTNRNHAA